MRIPRAVLFDLDNIGDHPDADVRGAAEAGLTAVWLTTWADSAPHATYSIASLSELLPMTR